VDELSPPSALWRAHLCRDDDVLHSRRGRLTLRLVAAGVNNVMITRQEHGWPRPAVTASTAMPWVTGPR
jgi:hypothetical protein